MQRPAFFYAVPGFLLCSTHLVNVAEQFLEAGTDLLTLFAHGFEFGGELRAGALGFFEVNAEGVGHLLGIFQFDGRCHGSYFFVIGHCFRGGFLLGRGCFRSCFLFITETMDQSYSLLDSLLKMIEGIGFLQCWRHLFSSGRGLFLGSRCVLSSFGSGFGSSGERGLRLLNEQGELG